MSLPALERSIKQSLQAIRDKIASGDDAEILLWLQEGTLACSQRPLRDHPQFNTPRPGRSPRPMPLPKSARPLVVDWVNRVKSHGIRSIVSLLEEGQHERYYVSGGLNLHPDGLYGYYLAQGFEFCTIPLTDYKTPSMAEMEAVLAAFDRMPKPVLLHCSAGIDRTSPVAAFIVSKRGEISENPQ